MTARRYIRPLVRAALLGVVGYYAVLAGEFSTFDLRGLDLERDRAEARVADLREQVDSLREVTGALASSDDAIERVARERFGMIRDGETLYRFVEVDGETGRERPLASVSP
jgi:cell division protein FtsB